MASNKTVVTPPNPVEGFAIPSTDLVMNEVQKNVNHLSEDINNYVNDHKNGDYVAIKGDKIHWTIEIIIEKETYEGKKITCGGKSTKEKLKKYDQVVVKTYVDQLREKTKKWDCSWDFSKDNIFVDNGQNVQVLGKLRLYLSMIV